MKIAIAQLNPTIGDLTGNARQILDAAQAAIAQGARLLLTTELSLCGYPPRDLLMQPSFLATMAETLAQLARDLPADLAVLVGTVLPNPDAVYDGEKPLFNTTALLLDSKVQRYFHKRLLPTYDVFDEDRYFEPGEESSAFELDGVWIGVTICEDLWNDESFWGKRHYEVNPIAELTRQGVDLVLNLSASPYSVGKQHLRENMLRHSATRYGQPILYANQVGGNDDLLFDGCSFGLNRAGELVVRAKAFEHDLVFAEFDPAVDELMPLPDAVAPLPDCAEAEIWMALVMGVRDYVRKCGFSKAVLGLSGGIDSALVAAIASAALGPENVLGVLMPSPYSSDHSITDALDLAKNLGIQTQTLPIAPMMQGYDQALSELFAGTEFGIAEENLQSRIRGTLLMAISNKFGHLLISTGNKSEMAVGYCTLYGDMNGGLGAIADVPKTRVYAICQWLNRETPTALDSSLLLRPTARPVIPPHILSKPPSAELKPGQVDQDSLPPYEVLDDILERFVERHEAPEDIVSAGHDAVIVNQVIRLVTRAEFKRKQAAPGLKITDRAFGTGWRMPIASRWLPTVQSPSVPAAIGH
ncbi:NAD+ synthase [Thermoleptolyngbya sp. C42_A2020_037]|uniref:NAD+ synthase n=1 Tax=Thermoleptolyngbya sp. C42_A2020_037 TaxID=2747799 RepID=UPI0019E4DDC2|nr:NAD+ synthase [Thermoleptolyngbya sp. C42_A2020_037]MBF2085278.1 NAD+ synthase [Thermoleptolyngbya sp. C42_A2020_037]